MAEARDWARFASSVELDAYALASFERMTADRRRAVVAHIRRRGAAWANRAKLATEGEIEGTGAVPIEGREGAIRRGAGGFDRLIRPPGD